MKLISVHLEKPCLIAGTIYPQGTELTATEAAIAEGYKAHERIQLRGQIKRQVGDPESLIGTTADAASLNLLATSALVQVLASSGSVAIKEGLKAALDGQLVPLTADFLVKVDSGEIVLPALAKGLENTLGDVAARSTGVAKVLAATSGN